MIFININNMEKSNFKLEYKIYNFQLDLFKFI